jgi:hypothetical protein
LFCIRSSIHSINKFAMSNATPALNLSHLCVDDFPRLFSQLKYASRILDEATLEFGHLQTPLTFLFWNLIHMFVSYQLALAVLVIQTLSGKNYKQTLQTARQRSWQHKWRRH